MAKLGCLAIDRLTGDAIHISEVPEGYQNAICPDCKSQLVAANRHPKTRKVAEYFIHSGNHGLQCSAMTALHQFAQQIIKRRKQVLLPEFSHSIPNEGGGDCFTLNRPSYLADIDETEIEELYPTETRLFADVAGSEAGKGRLYIEIWVHHKVDPPKAESLREADLDVVEINLGSLADRADLSKREIEEAVLRSAPRTWIAHARFKDDIEKLKQSVLGGDKEGSKRVLLTDKELGLMSRYSELSNRRGALKRFEEWIERKGGPGNDTFARLMMKFGTIPNIVNIPVPGELAFKVHRIHWQTLIFQELQRRYDAFAKKSQVRGRVTLKELIPEASKDDQIDPLGAYKILKDQGVELTQLSKVFEDVAGIPLPERYEERPENLPFLTPGQYKLLPKPLTAVKNYLRALDELGILAGQGEFFSFMRGRRPDILNRLEKLPSIGKAGLTQYIESD